MLEAVVSDQAAFEQAVRAESRALYGLALSILRNSQEAEDAVQETMELAWRSWNAIRDPDRRSAWLKTICVRRCFGIRRRRFGILPLSEHERDERPSAAADPDLDRAYGLLSLRQRAVVRLHYRDGYTLDECAALMGCRPGTARSQLNRGLKKLRQELSNDQ